MEQLMKNQIKIDKTRLEQLMEKYEYYTKPYAPTEFMMQVSDYKELLAITQRAFGFTETTVEVFSCFGDLSPQSRDKSLNQP